MNKNIIALILFTVTSSSYADWGYHTSKDEMSGKVSTMAHLDSNNIVELDFPYNEPQKAKLAILKLSNGSLLVTFNLMQGQIACGYSAHYECEARIKFDDKEAEKWPYSKPQIDRNYSISFNQSKALVNQIERSKKVMIELSFYGGSYKVFKFSPKGIDANKVK